MMSRRKGRLVLATALVAMAVPGVAEWMVVNLHPPGAYSSHAWGVDNGKQAGDCAWTAGYPAAVLWTGNAAGMVSLNPPSSAYSVAWGIAGGRQGGGANVAGTGRAALWSGTASSWVDLHPLGASASSVFGASADQQVGFAEVSTRIHASLWTGTAASWRDLHPAGAYDSMCNGVGGGQQVGHFRPSISNLVPRACLWTGTAASRVDLNPLGATMSDAYAAEAGKQAGYAVIAGVAKASLWTGSAALWVDLTPPGHTGDSVAYGMGDGYQAGAVVVGGRGHASIWSGTPESHIDLHLFDPGEFQESTAWDVEDDGTNIYVVGYGIRTSTQTAEALMWIHPSFGPHLDPIDDKTVAELTNLTFNATASGLGLSYSLVSPPPGATISSSTGAFQWQPTEVQGPGDYTFTVRVTDSQYRTDEEAITVHVTEANERPWLAAIPGATINEEELFQFQLVGTDSDFPAQNLTYYVVAGAPAGLSVNPTSGLLTWTPTEAQGPGVYFVTAGVSDSFGAIDQELFALTVLNVDKIISGRVDLSGYVGDITAQPVTFEIRNAGQTSALHVRVVNLASNGYYSFIVNSTAVGTGPYDIAAKASHWLRKVKANVGIASSGAQQVDFTGGFALVNGDVDGDNSVGIADYAILSSAYGTSQGDTGWNSAADLNGDNAVDIADYAILSSSYGLDGDE